jgi:hypothetical protein
MARGDGDVSGRREYAEVGDGERNHEHDVESIDREHFGSDNTTATGTTIAVLGSRPKPQRLKARASNRRRTTGSHRRGVAVLQGTFETLGVAELLGLLAHARKTGALWLDAGSATAVVYVADGRCCAALSNDTPGPLDDAPSLLVRLVELCFAVSRAENGSFRLGVEDPPWTCNEPVDLEAANAELARVLEEWRSIQEVVPSLECRLRLTDELRIEELSVDRECWRLLTAIDGRRNLRELARRTDRPVLDVCHAVVALVDAGACNVEQAAASLATVPRSTGGKAARAPALPRPARSVP